MGDVILYVTCYRNDVQLSLRFNEQGGRRNLLLEVKDDSLWVEATASRSFRLSFVRRVPLSELWQPVLRNFEIRPVDDYTRVEFVLNGEVIFRLKEEEGCLVLCGEDCDFYAKSRAAMNRAGIPYPTQRALGRYVMSDIPEVYKGNDTHHLIKDIFLIEDGVVEKWRRRMVEIARYGSTLDPCFVPHENTWYEQLSQDLSEPEFNSRRPL